MQPNIKKGWIKREPPWTRQPTKPMTVRKMLIIDNPFNKASSIDNMQACDVAKTKLNSKQA